MTGDPTTVGLRLYYTGRREAATDRTREIENSMELGLEEDEI